jgi:hypothetical protein
MAELTTGRADTFIRRRPAEVFAAVADVTRMGEWSPETVACRWLDGGQTLGARFEGDNVAALGPVTLKRWTTTSEVTEYREPAVFEFVAEGTTTWRFELTPEDDGTRVTESFSHPRTTGVQRVLYNLMGSRRRAMEKGMEQTLRRLKLALES